MDATILDRVIARIDSYHDTIIRLQEELISRPALAPENGGQGEAKKSDFLHAYLKDPVQCDKVDLFNAPDSRVPANSRPNIVAKIRGESSARTFWIIPTWTWCLPEKLSSGTAIRGRQESRMARSTAGGLKIISRELYLQ